MDMLACNDGGDRVCFTCGTFNTSIFKLSSLLFQASLNGSRITVVMFSIFNWNNIVQVLLGQNLAVLDGLDRGVEMILMNLAIDGSLDLLMTTLLDGLLHDGRSNLLMHGRIVVTGLGPTDRQR